MCCHGRWHGSGGYYASFRGRCTTSYSRERSASPAPTRKARLTRASVCDQREPVAVNDLHSIAFVHRRPRPLGHRLAAPIVEPDLDDVVRFFLRVLFDLIAGVGADPRTGDGRRGVSAP